MKVRHINNRPWLRKGPEAHARKRYGRKLRRKAAAAADLLEAGIRGYLERLAAKREAALRDLSRLSDEIGQELDSEPMAGRGA